MTPPSSALAEVAGQLGGLAPTVDPMEQLRLRDEIDALVAHLYGLSRDEFAHILDTFPLVFPNTAEGAAKQAALLGVYEEIQQGQSYG